MVNIRSANEIILSLIDFYRLAQPNMTTVPGTVSRDLFIEGPAATLSLLYDELSGISNKQSLRLSIGTDLDKLAQNYAVTRKQSTPSTGVALLTFSSLNSVININAGNSIFTTSGLSFSVLTGISVAPSNANFYKSVASKYQAQLAFVGITDQYAVEVTVQAVAAGSSGNIGQYSLDKTSISGISNVTNVSTFTGGTDQETDAAFRNRILSIFSGSSVGTTLGYLNAALSVAGVEDVAIIGPGNPLMTRDGTVSETVNGTLTVISEGSGGKVDVVVLGSDDIPNTDTFIYQDKSNNNDPTNAKNNFVLGQILADVNKTISKKRIDDIAAGQLPAQPIDTILQVTGSLSGSNFLPFSTDGYGRTSGNYELIKDTGVYGGSPFGFDTFEWKSNQIVFQEDLIKGQNNGQDATTFTDVVAITDAQQNIAITNENSMVTFDRSIIQLLHTPVSSVTRVFNTNTGERYLITNQNVDNTSPNNTTGLIQISGNTLPSPSDVLQVDYNWIVDYDPYSDFDGLISTNNPRAVSDSIDWGYASVINDELVNFTLNTSNNYFTGTTTHPIDTVISANTFFQVDGYVSEITSGVFVNRLAVIVSNLSAATTSVNSITFKNSNVELYNTAQNNGSFSNSNIIIGINLLFATTIILPSDTSAIVGDRVNINLNKTNIYQSSTLNGSSNGNQITIPSALLNIVATNITLQITYIANVSDLFSIPITNLPASHYGNGYLLNNNNGFTNFSIINQTKRENQVVQLNLSSQFFVELSLPVSDYTINNVISVIRLSDSKELWNADNKGNVITGVDGNFQLILTGFNIPVIADRVLVIYSVIDIRRFQPFSFNNQIIKTRIDQLTSDPTSGKLTLPLVSFVAQASALHFEVIDPNTNISLFTITDGYLAPIPNTATANLSSLSVNFNTLPDLTNKIIKINGASSPNNDGYFEILSYNFNTNNLLITNSLTKIIPDQISVIRLLDNNELWSYQGTIDTVNNRIIFPTVNATIGDQVFVMFFNFENLRKSPTRILGTTVDQNINTGVMTINGTSIGLAQDIIFTATATGLQLNLQEAIRKALNLNSSATISTNVKLAKIIKLEKVITYNETTDIVIEVINSFDVNNSQIANSLYYSDTMISNDSLNNFSFILPNTINNSATVPNNNLPTIGDKLRVTFYYTIDNDSENLLYTRIGSLYSNKKFALINKVFVSSGFNSSQGTKFIGTAFNKPGLGSRYTAFYNYTAPKENERIIIQYNYNKLISDTTFTIEASRPINADVLVRAAKLVNLDLTMNVVISPTFVSTTTTVLQNLRSQLTAALTTTTLGQEIDQVTLINIAQGIQGIARARILYFNITGGIGQVLSVVANEDQYFQPNNITINTENR